MKNNKNLQNLLLLVSIILVLGLGCSNDEPSARKPLPRSTPENNNLNENKKNENENVNLNVNTANNITTNENMTKASEKMPVTVDKTNFYSVLEYSLSKHKLKKSDICDENNPVEKRILDEYGAVFLTKAMPPSACMFKSENDVSAFQNKLTASSENIGGAKVELQSDALKSLLAAIEEAKSQGLKITPRDGEEASKRSFDKTLALWKSRFEPACEHWKGKGRLTAEQITKLKSMPINEQVKAVLEFEKQGIYFNTNFTATILSSVAAPGTSQHLSMLAFDAVEFQDSKIRQIMANHGWFRTVKGDEPHFTFLGVKEEELKNMGLQKIETPKGEFWIPNV